MNGTCRTQNHSVVAPVEIKEEKDPGGRSGGTDSLYMDQSVRHSEAPKTAPPIGRKPEGLSHQEQPELTEHKRTIGGTETGTVAGVP